MIERFHSTLKGRTKVMRGLKTLEGASTILDGWLIYYNFFKPHESLHMETPAMKAGIKDSPKNWLDVIESVKETPKTITVPFKPVTVFAGKPSRYGAKRKVRKPTHQKVVRENKTMPTITQIRR